MVGGEKEKREIQDSECICIIVNSYLPKYGTVDRLQKLKPLYGGPEKLPVI